MSKLEQNFPAIFDGLTANTELEPKFQGAYHTACTATEF